MSKNISFLGADYSDVPAVILPQTGGDTARFDDASITTAVAGDVASGKIFLAADGTITTGSMTVKTIYTGAAAPSSSLGTDGDIYIQTGS